MYEPTPSSYKIKLVLITVAITAVATSLAWIGIGVAAYSFIYTEPPSFQVNADYPETVKLGEEFEIKLSVENTGRTGVQLANIDLYDELMDGFEVISIDPKPRTTEKLYGFSCHHLLKDLSPGDVHHITFKVRAKAVGAWEGDIDACNFMQNMVTHYAQIEVLNPASPDPNPQEEE